MHTAFPGVSEKNLQENKVKKNQTKQTNNKASTKESLRKVLAANKPATMVQASSLFVIGHTARVYVRFFLVQEDRPGFYASK